MKSLIIKELAIINSNTKTAKYATFEKGINVVTSRKDVNGNYVGKSSLLRSIFHTLGADGKFAYSLWEKEGKYTYILRFEVGSDEYTLLRYESMFRLLDQRNVKIFEVINRGDLAVELCKLFNQEIYLKDKQGMYRLAHPAFNYLLNYIDQKEIRVCDFQSFNNLNAFSDIYSDLIYSHLGVSTNDYNQIRMQIDEHSKRMQELTKRKEIYDEMLKEITKHKELNVSYDEIQSLKFQLTKYQDDYASLLQETNANKDKLFKISNTKIEIENVIEDLRKFVANEDKKVIIAHKKHSCPTCNSLLKDDTITFFNKAIDIDGARFQLLDAERELNGLIREIELIHKKYEQNVSQMKEMENRIFDNKTGIDQTLASIGVKQIKENIYKEYQSNRAEFERLVDLKKSLADSLRRLAEKKERVKTTYIKKLYHIVNSYKLGGLELSSINKIEDKIRVDGTRVNITMVAWLCALLATKYDHNPDSVIYPLICDNPNNADFDDANEQKIFSLLFDNLPPNGQIITSLVGFDPSKYPVHKIDKILFLDNPENSLLNSRDYSICMNRFSNII